LEKYITLARMKMTTLFPVLLFFSGIAGAQTGRPQDIPEAGRIRVDGRLEDWRLAEWAPLDQTLDGNPVNISNAQWSIQWNDDPALFIAVRYDDADVVLQNGTNRQDCIEIFVRGDDGSRPADYAKDQSSAQHYIFGLTADKVTVWKRLANVDPFPSHNPAKAAVTLSGNTFVYEIMVPLYDKFSVTNRHDCETTEVFAELEVGIDLAIVDAGPAGYAGRKSENTLSGKENDAGAIALHTLTE
jgi:hypothetical protein